ncbi:hypothetical protein F3Y22_tig00110895pilonHSYRG00140 [Hibiscus syriacus]|uniref:DUF659 domain-containing protein n=1 Tax=Hibiscus syriacus TaxID=106335 RepID=A0A6A2ZE83_HIBSY|nr:hypothetical protein F3Y22_tig00110895pilonHSYRG00140 [Hibiscus syriacus]
MPPREEFPTKGLEGAPSNDIGWHFGTPVPNARGSTSCKLCGKVVKGGITRFKEHIAHKTGNVAPCPNVTDKKRRTEEFLSQLREEGDENEGFIDEIDAIRQATRESIKSQHEWHRREEFRRSTSGWSNIYEEGRPSHGLVGGYRQERTSKSIPTVSKFLIYERLPFQLASSPRLYNLIQVSIEVGQGVKLPTPYKVSDVYLESEFERVRDWVNGMKTHWKDFGATLMCDGWTNSLNQMHIINFLVYCSKGTVFWKSMDVSSVRSRDAKFYYNLLDSVVEEIGESYIVQIVTDNEAAMKAAGKKIMLKRKHLYWTSCAAHCLDLCLEDIGKRPSVAKVLQEAKKVTCFIDNHIWIVDLMKKYTQGKQILRPALTRFATHFIQLEEITRQKQGLREMFNSKVKSKWRQQKIGPTYETKKIILGKEFWKKTNDLIKVYEPLVKVLRLVDSDEKPTMGFIYEAVDRAKRAIQQDCRYFTEYEKIIHNRWNFMHSDLHSTGYFLKPQFQFGVEYSDNVLIETLEGTTSGHFRDRSKFGGNISLKSRRDRSEPKAPSKGKCKKHTSVGSSSSRRSSSSNLGQGDSSTSTQGFYPPEQFPYFQPLHGYPQPYGYYPSFSNYGVPYQPQMYPPPPMYQPPQPLMPRESSQEGSQNEGEGSELPRHSTNW